MLATATRAHLTYHGVGVGTLKPHPQCDLEPNAPLAPQVCAHVAEETRTDPADLTVDLPRALTPSGVEDGFTNPHRVGAVYKHDRSSPWATFYLQV